MWDLIYKKTIIIIFNYIITFSLKLKYKRARGGKL